jgi:hypothetical protein
MTEEVIQRGRVGTLFSVGSRIKSTASVMVIDFLDTDEFDKSYVVASVALEMNNVETLIEGLQHVLEAIKNDS